MFLRRVIVTDHGVYRPMALVPRVVLYVLAFLAIAVAALTGRLPATSAAMYCALLGVPFAWALYTYMKHGKLGRPSVEISQGNLHMDRPQSSNGMVRFPLAELKEILIYGMRGKRIYRFTSGDGGCEDVSPLWSRQVEAGVIAFLQDRLPSGVKVTVEEPQSLFEALRRDPPR
jgi:hypothetical protein